MHWIKIPKKEDELNKLEEKLADEFVLIGWSGENDHPGHIYPAPVQLEEGVWLDKETGLAIITEEDENLQREMACDRQPTHYMRVEPIKTKTKNK